MGKRCDKGAEMYRQMELFDFIKEPLTLFEQLFKRAENPVLNCVNCLCRYCANNAEEVWRHVRPEEVGQPCFNCDTCQSYTGSPLHKEQAKEDCAGFLLSGYGAGIRRKEIKVWNG